MCGCCVLEHSPFVPQQCLSTRGSSGWAKKYVAFRHGWLYWQKSARWKTACFASFFAALVFQTLEVIGFSKVHKTLCCIHAKRIRRVWWSSLLPCRTFSRSFALRFFNPIKKRSSSRRGPGPLPSERLARLHDWHGSPTCTYAIVFAQILSMMSSTFWRFNKSNWGPAKISQDSTVKPWLRSFFDRWPDPEKSSRHVKLEDWALSFLLRRRIELWGDELPPAHFSVSFGTGLWTFAWP